LAKYFIRRIIHTALVALAALIVVFGLVRLSGDPAALIAGADATPEQIAQIHRNLGLDRPIYVQLGDYLWKAAHGDFGESRRLGPGRGTQPVAGDD
jgi:peptide/nickel transport system permease protein